MSSSSLSESNALDIQKLCFMVAKKHSFKLPYGRCYKYYLHLH